MKKLLEVMMKMNVWVLFAVSVLGAIGFSVALGVLINDLFYHQGDNLLMLGAVVIPALDAPVFIVMLIVLIKELRKSREELNSRVQVRTEELTRSNNALLTEMESREKLQLQLVQAQKMESIGRLAGGIAHDFNNILSVIIGYAEMAQLSMDEKDPIRSNIDEILSAAFRSRDITRQLLSFARQDSIVPRPIELNTEIEGAISILARLIGEDITLHWHSATEDLTVEMDPAQLNQILTNLCVNARDAISGTGTVRISLEAEVEPDPDPGLPDRKFAVLKVADDGCGMSEEEREKAFDPFFTTKEVGKGTGLGLATVYGIVRQNNCSISIKTAPGKGTTFSIAIPVCGKEKVSEERDVPSSSIVGRGESILLVEDERSILKMLTRLLEQHGFRVVPVSDPNDALETMENDRGIGLVITDIVMPGMNGIELADRIRTGYPGTKIIMMSGYSAEVISRRGISNRDFSILKKPISITELLESVHSAIREL